MKILNYINGELVASVTGKTLPVLNPATGSLYATAPDSDLEDIESAVKAASLAFPKWAATPTHSRSELLRRLAEKIKDLKDELARAETVDTGKPIRVSSSVDIPRSQLNFEFFADAITTFSSECHSSEASLNYTLRNPLGVVGCISPWNLPLYLLTWKIAPALATGNTVIAKPTEITPVTAYLFSKICMEAGIPPGVINIVHGLGSKVGHAICAHPKIAAVSFTGSTETGAEIAQTTARSFKKLSLEMGGKNPTIVFADCNFEQAVNETVRSAFSNQGQICLCGSRILIEQSIYEAFKFALIKRTRDLKIGNPLNPEVDQGALVSKIHFDKILSYLDLAKKEGGKILVGGNPVHTIKECENGWFIEPTLIENLKSDCRINQEEIFGPVATLIPFISETEAIELANDTRYGLTASLFTQNLNRAHRLAAQLHVGIVWVNTWMLRDLRTPFGGTKNSGLGREGGLEALHFFTEPKNVCIKL